MESFPRIGRPGCRLPEGEEMERWLTQRRGEDPQPSGALGSVELQSAFEDEKISKSCRPCGFDLFFFPLNVVSCFSSHDAFSSVHLDYYVVLSRASVPCVPLLAFLPFEPHVKQAFFFPCRALCQRTWRHERLSRGPLHYLAQVCAGSRCSFVLPGFVSTLSDV